VIFEGDWKGEDLRVGIVVARWNERITRELLAGARDALRRSGANPESIAVAWVPGALEIPSAAKWLAETGSFDALICLGAVIRGATPHFEHVAATAIGGVAAIARETGLPVTTGILTTDTPEQAIERTGIKHGNKGAEAAMAAVEMARLRQRIAAGGSSDASMA